MMKSNRAFDRMEKHIIGMTEKSWTLQIGRPILLLEKSVSFILLQDGKVEVASPKDLLLFVTKNRLQTLWMTILLEILA